MKPLRNLVTVIHGSHLYGTDTPTSDRDYKSVHLPAGRDIVIGRPQATLNLGVISKADNGKNNGDAIDHDSYSLSKFCQMLLDGDGVATEILFAPESAIVEKAPEWDEIRDACKTLLTREIRGFVGYCKQQAAKYGVKGSRMEAVEKLVAVLEKAIEKHGLKARLEVIAPELEKLAAEVEMINLVSIDTAHGYPMMHLECVDRKLAYRINLFEVHKVYKKVWDNYGVRAQAAKNSEGVDWKAVSHAVRVARQAHELLATGKITFPRPDAEELLSIKQGKFKYPDIAPMLEELVATLATVPSDLPESVSPEAKDEIVFTYYKGQIG